ncbi:putative RING-H2 finger protein ATL69 [Rhodamnia argentea]|uniref:RING-H2 finger protein ATL69 n=1 Tax=Rhodamnia argentea TaxID=178133 RepID=A0A8B8Q088_9MYRT|nr:putative RING-H2 finger protein ATL69 [Rhodamnia argentea]
MSSSADPPATTGVGLGYGIAIAVSLLVLISTIMLASYACVRVKSHNLRATSDGDADAADPSPHAAETAVTVGMEGEAIETHYPKLVLGESKRLPKHNEGGPCSICLAEYEAKDVIRCVPECSHCFHADCAEAWLRVSATCPLCRRLPAAMPLATPLSELVPLATNPR